MNFAIIGGDSRSAYAADCISAAGHRVRCHNVPYRPDYSLADALGRADVVVLPIPAKQLNIALDTLLPLLPPHCRVFSGAVGPTLHDGLEAGGFSVTDVLDIESLAVENAALTARAAVTVLQSALPKSLAGESVLVLGAGRIGKLLGLELARVGAAVTVAARNPADRARCRALGLNAAEFVALPACPIVVNTIPARVVPPKALAPGALILELASIPGGFDRDAAEALGHTVIDGGGLPGKYLPESAGYAIGRTILELIME